MAIANGLGDIHTSIRICKRRKEKFIRAKREVFMNTSLRFAEKESFNGD